MSPAANSTFLTATKLAQIEAIERDACLDMYSAAPADVAAELGLEHHRLDDGALLISRRLDHLLFNRLLLGSHSPAREDVLDASISAFDAVGVRNWVVQIPQDSGPLEALCRSKGLARHRRTWARFVRGPETVQAQTNLAIRAVGQREARSFGEVAARTYGLPPAAARWLSALVGRPRWTCLMAFDGEIPVATGASFVDGAAGWLGLGATVSDHRGRGAQSALLAARIAAAVNQGCDTLTTETGVPLPDEAGPSYNNIQRVGFRIAHLRLNFCRQQA